MNKSLIELIDEQIAIHERAIAELSIARGVVANLTPKTRPAAKQTTQKAKTPQRGLTRGFIMDAVNRLGRPSLSKEIWQNIVKVGGVEIPQKKVWNALYVMAENGQLNRTKDGLYGVPGRVVPAPDVAA